ncbi:MAG: glycosyltransferase [Armatimonadota bacterium]
MDDKYLLFRFVPTMRCNFRCSYCFVSNDEKSTRDTMFDLHSPEEWVRAMGNYSDHDVEFYCWGGEPFLLDGTYDIVKGWTAYDHVISGSRLDTNISFAEKIAKRCPTDKVKLNCSWHTQYHTLEQEESKIRLLNDLGMVGMLNFVASPYNMDILKSQYNMSVDDLIARFDEIGVFVNIAGDFALVDNPRSPGYAEYKEFISQYLCPEDWKHLRCEKTSSVCEANRHFFTVHPNGDITPCLSGRVCGNFFKGTLNTLPAEVCNHKCPSLVAYPFRTDNQFPFRQHLVEYVNRNREYRESLKKHPSARSFTVQAPEEEKTPRVSVVMPSYNHMQYLPHAVESVLAQTYKDFELIIVNDGSTDGTRSYLDGIKDPRVKLIHQENKRLPGALNTGFTASRGELLTWTSADNLCLPGFLETLVAALDAHPEAGFACSAFDWIDDNGRLTGQRISDQNLHYYSLLSCNPGIASFMYRRTCMDEVGLYDTELEGAEDWDMWLRIMERFQPVYVPEVLYHYRTHGQSMTAQIPEKIRKTARAAFDKAMARLGEEIDLADLYPAIELCRDQDAANFHACLDFGSRLLESPFDALDKACIFLEVAHTLVPESLHVASNLAVAYAKAGRWDESLQLVNQIKMADDPYLQDVCREIEEARNSDKADILSTLSVFSISRGSVELFRLDDEQRLVYKPVGEENPADEVHCDEFSTDGMSGTVMIVAPDTSSDLLPFAKALQEIGYKPVMLHPVSKQDTPDYEIGKTSLDGIEIRTINCLTSSPYWCFGDPRLESVFGRILTDEDVDLVHFIHSEGSLSPLLIEKARLAGIPTVLTLCNADLMNGREGNSTGPDEFAVENAYARRLGATCNLVTASDQNVLQEVRSSTWAAGFTVGLAGISASYVHDWAVCYHNLIGDVTPPETDKVISLVITTYNRPEWLKICLEGFCNQTLPSRNFEILVIDDHSDDDLSSIITEYSERIPLRYIRHDENRGVGAGRNTGAKAAKGDFVAFFDDDDRPTRRLLAEHMRSHLEHPEDNEAVLGYTSWDPELELTPVMYHVTEVGQQYLSYPSIKPNVPLPWHCFWGGTASIKRKLLMEVANFDEGTPVCEDMDLAFRLRHTGFKVYYNPRIISYILRSFDYSAFKKRRLTFGVAATQITRKHQSPELAAYFAVPDAAGKWNRVEPVLADLESNIGWLEESTLPELRAKAVDTANGVISAEQLLHQLYYSAFDAYRWKGYIDEVASIRNKALSERGEAPNILVIDKCLPYFDRASGSLRLFNMLKLLRKLGCSITFVSMMGSMEERYVPILESMGIEVHPWDPQALERAGYKVDKAPLDYESIFGGQKFDYAIMEFWDVAQYYMPLIRKYAPDTEVIVDTVDIHFVREMREAELKNDNPLMETAAHKKRMELNVYRQADRLWVITEQEKQTIGNIIKNVPVEVVPNIHGQVNVEKVFDQTSDLLFVGNFNHPPNADAVRYFCKEIFPTVQKQIPDIKLHVVGGNPPEDIKLLASDNIIVTGYVENLPDYLKMARVSVSPLRYGAGMKGKVGEALAWGLPVVTTSIGAEGMDLTHGHNVLIGDTPDEFASQVVNLYRDRGLWERLSQAGKQKAAEWSPESVESRLRKMLFGRSPAPREKTVSIVILAYNQLYYTKKCLESIEQYTNVPYELIVVDNCSTDGTADYLDSLTDRWEKSEIENGFCKAVKVIKNSENLGYAAGNNCGIAASTGDYVLLLNNDVVVTPGWLERLVRPMEYHSGVGITGPMSNFVSGSQLVKHACYNKSTLEGLNEFAAELAKEYNGEILSHVRVVGFSMLISRSVIEEVGGLDTRYGLGNFEDDDYCIRAVIAGFSVLIVKDCFVHHFGSQTFAGENIDRDRLIMKNWELFKEKWGLPSDIPHSGSLNLAPLIEKPFDPCCHYCAAAQLVKN